MKLRKMTFTNRNGFELEARLDLPEDGDINTCALFAHCFTCTKNIKAAANIGRALAGSGVATFRFDFTGLGESEGEFSETNFSSNVTDLVDAAEFMKGELEAPSIVIGHSLGGAAAIRAAASIGSCRAVVTIAAPAEPGHLIRALKGSLDEIEEEGEAYVTIAGRRLRIKKQFVDDLRKTEMGKAIEGLRRALLIFHSPLDNIVGIDNAAAIFKAAKHPKSFISLGDADHLLGDERDSRYVGRVIAAWAERYVL